MAAFDESGGTTGVSVTAEQLQLNGGATARAVLAQVLHDDKTLAQLAALDRVQELHRRLVPPEAPSSGVDAAALYGALEAAVCANAVGATLLLVRVLGAVWLCRREVVLEMGEFYVVKRERARVEVRARWRR